MLFDIAWPELLLIGTIALVVIGPKDLPRAMRVAGFWIRKARTLSREFQSTVDQMIREAELDEVREELRKAGEFDVGKELRNTIDPTGELAESIKPPEIPDHFEEAEGPQPGTIAAPSEEPAALPAPAEEPLPGEATAAEAAPEPARTDSGEDTLPLPQSPPAAAAAARVPATAPDADTAPPAPGH